MSVITCIGVDFLLPDLGFKLVLWLRFGGGLCSDLMLLVLEVGWIY